MLFVLCEALWLLAGVAGGLFSCFHGPFYLSPRWVKDSGLLCFSLFCKVDAVHRSSRVSLVRHVLLLWLFLDIFTIVCDKYLLLQKKLGSTLSTQCVLSVDQACL